jgi:hypothetical protein
VETHEPTNDDVKNITNRTVHAANKEVQNVKGDFLRLPGESSAVDYIFERVSR